MKTPFKYPNTHSNFFIYIRRNIVVLSWVVMKNYLPSTFQELSLGETRTRRYCSSITQNPSNMIWASGSQITNARQSGFTLERALVGRKQVHIYEQRGDIYVKNLHDHCNAYILERDSNKPYVLNDSITVENQTRIFVDVNAF